MPTKVVSYKCDICDKVHETIALAKKCEKLGTPTHTFKVGDRLIETVPLYGGQEHTIDIEILECLVRINSGASGILQHVAHYKVREVYNGAIKHENTKYRSNRALLRDIKRGRIVQIV